MDTLTKEIQDYIAWTKETFASRNKVQAYLGMGEEKQADHMAFYNRVGQWVQCFLETDPEDASLLQALHILLFAAAQEKGSQAEWYLIAIQTFAQPMIERLGREEKKDLAQEYARHYPRGKRLPVQNQIYRMLAEKRKKFLFF